MAEGTDGLHHPQKIALVLTVMRTLAAHLRGRGFTASYFRLDNPETGPTLLSELLRRIAPRRPIGPPMHPCPH